jgi:aldose sugar dehydrogenase
MRTRLVSRALQRLAVAACVTVCGLLWAGPASAASITAAPVATGLTFPSGFDFAPDGRIFYGEHPTGAVRIYDPATQNDTLFVQIPSGHDPDFSLISLQLNPQYPTKPYVYVYLTHQISGVAYNEIIRYTDVAGTGANPKVIWSTQAGPNHNGGALVFGPDNMLYLVAGDQDNSANSQDLGVDQGKVLRITPTGGTPKSNPFGTHVWAYGTRNSIGLNFDPLTGRLWHTDNGPACGDELNRIVKGGNYGWGPNKDCHVGTQPENTNNSGPNPILPELWYTPTIAPTGLSFCSGCGLNAEDEGVLFFGSFNDGNIHRVTLDAKRKHATGETIPYTDPNGGILHMQQGIDGAIYFSDPTGIFKLVLAS